MAKEWPWWPPRATSARPRLAWSARRAPRADSKFILKLLILITTLAGTWYYLAIMDTPPRTVLYCTLGGLIGVSINMTNHDLTPQLCIITSPMWLELTM